jgi:hypothetical protein
VPASIALTDVSTGSDDECTSWRMTSVSERPTTSPASPSRRIADMALGLAYAT